MRQIGPFAPLCNGITTDNMRKKNSNVTEINNDHEKKLVDNLARAKMSADNILITPERKKFADNDFENDFKSRVSADRMGKSSHYNRRLSVDSNGWASNYKRNKNQKVHKKRSKIKIIFQNKIKQKQ